MGCVTNCPALGPYPTDGCSLGFEVVLVPYNCERCAKYMCLPINGSKLAAVRSMAISFIIISVFLVLFLTYTLVHRRLVEYLSANKLLNRAFHVSNSSGTNNNSGIRFSYGNGVEKLGGSNLLGSVYQTAHSHLNNSISRPSDATFDSRRGSDNSALTEFNEIHTVNIYNVESAAVIKPIAFHMDTEAKANIRAGVDTAKIDIDINAGINKDANKGIFPGSSTKVQGADSAQSSRVEFIDISLNSSNLKIVSNTGTLSQTLEPEQTTTVVMRPMMFQKVELNRGAPKVFSVLGNTNFLFKGKNTSNLSDRINLNKTKPKHKSSKLATRMASTIDKSNLTDAKNEKKH